MASSSSSYSATQTRGSMYDVFLSFRGEDTRNNFVDHLYAALVQKGIHTFKDDKMLGGGTPISQELIKAIKGSRCAVIVFSKNYVNSSWCLEELTKIMECREQIGQKVFPVFYHVDPSDVRSQKGDFVTGFLKHEEKFKEEMNKVKKWRDALTGAANLSGWHITTVNGGEHDHINKIVLAIFYDLQTRGREKDLVGIESRLDPLHSLLRMEATREVLIIGILGMGGIGKTTIARALFRRISYKFEGSSFINDVRENGSSKTQICALQKRILRDILGHEFPVDDPENGADMIQDRLCNKRVLLVLDDVDECKQLEFLVATHEWFGPGSRIIITTRNEHLLLVANVNAKYRPALLSVDQAVELFSWHAFREHRPPDEFKELSKCAIASTGRLPLALKVLGSFFRGRNVCVWESALDRLAKAPNTKIFETLKLSFDGLNVFEQKIFLDIACVFKGEKKEYVIEILDSCGFHASIGIAVLIEKSLITIANQRLGMHDLIQEMGVQIVGESFPNSRLWKLEEIHGYITKNKELNAIEAIVEPFEWKEMHLRPNVFRSMKNLRILDAFWYFTSSRPTVLPDELRWLRWKQCPFSSLPLSGMLNLVRFELSGGSIKRLWDSQVMPNLKYIKLSHLPLTSFPDVSCVPNLETLLFESCEKLVEVHKSLGSHRKLVYLDMFCCNSLKCLPFLFQMESLKSLSFVVCGLETSPEFSPRMINLSHLRFHQCYKLKHLTSSIGCLSNLCSLTLLLCTSLVEIPNSIYELKCLKTLCLGNFRKLRVMESIQYLMNFHSLANLCSLRKLDLSWRQIREEDFPENLHGFSTLEELRLTGNSKLVQLPASICHLSHLKHLEIDSCDQLQTLHALPSGLQVLRASDCHELEKIKDLSEEHDSLCMIWLFDCKKLLEDQENVRYMDKMLKQSFLKKCAVVDRCLSIGIPGSKIPSWFNDQQYGNVITLKLHPGWQTQIKGFAICAEFERLTDDHHYAHDITIRFESNGMFIPKLEVDCVNAFTATGNGNVWICYIPFSFFQQMHGDDIFEYSDWSVEGNLVIRLFLGTKPVKCGVFIVYKEDLELTEHIKPSISSYWNWKLVYERQDVILCRLVIDGIALRW